MVIQILLRFVYFFSSDRRDPFARPIASFCVKDINGVAFRGICRRVNGTADYLMKKRDVNRFQVRRDGGEP